MDYDLVSIIVYIFAHMHRRIPDTTVLMVLPLDGDFPQFPLYSSV